MRTSKQSPYPTSVIILLLALNTCAGCTITVRPLLPGKEPDSSPSTATNSSKLRTINEVAARAWECFSKEKNPTAAEAIMAESLTQARSSSNVAEKCNFLGVYGAILSAHNKPEAKSMILECLDVYNQSPINQRVPQIWMAHIMRLLAAQEDQNNDPDAETHWTLAYELLKTARGDSKALTTADKKVFCQQYIDFLKKHNLHARADAVAKYKHTL